MGNGASSGGAGPANAGPPGRGGQPHSTAERLIQQHGLGAKAGPSELTPRGSGSIDDPKPAGKHATIAVADPRTVMYKGAKGGLVDKLKHVAVAGTTSKQGSPNQSAAGSRAGSRAPSRAGSEKSMGAHSHAGSHMSLAQRIAQARRDEFDVDSDDEDLEGFIYEDESTSEDEREDYVNAFSRKKKLPKANDYSDYEGAGVRALTAGRKAPKSAAMKRHEPKRRSDSDEDEEGEEEDYDPEEAKIRLLRQKKRAEERARTAVRAAQAAAAMSQAATGGKRLDDGSGPSGRGGIAPKPPSEPPVRGSSGNIRRGQAGAAGGSGGGAPPGAGRVPPVQQTVNYGASAASQYWQEKRDKDNMHDDGGGDQPEMSRLEQLLAMQKKKAEREERQKAAEAAAAARSRAKSAKKAGGGGIRWNDGDEDGDGDDEEAEAASPKRKVQGADTDGSGGGGGGVRSSPASQERLSLNGPAAGGAASGPSRSQPGPSQAPRELQPGGQRDDHSDELMRLEPPPPARAGQAGRDGSQPAPSPPPGQAPNAPGRRIGGGSGSGADPNVAAGGSGYNSGGGGGGTGSAMAQQQPPPPHHAEPNKKATTDVTDFDVDDLLSSFEPPGAGGGGGKHGSPQQWAGSRPADPPPNPQEYVAGVLHGPPEPRRSIRMMSDFVTVPRNGTTAAVSTGSADGAGGGGGRRHDEDVVDLATRMLSLPVAAPRPSGGPTGAPVHSAPAGPGGALSTPPASIAASRFSRMGVSGTATYCSDGGLSSSVGNTPTWSGPGGGGGGAGGGALVPTYGASPGTSPLRPSRLARQPSSDGSAPPGLGGGGGGALRLGSPRVSLNGVDSGSAAALPGIRSYSPARLSNAGGGTRGSEGSSPSVLNSGGSSILNSVVSDPPYGRGSVGGMGVGAGAAGLSRFGAATHSSLQQEAARSSMPNLPADRGTTGYDSDGALNKPRGSWNGAGGLLGAGRSVGGTGSGMRVSGMGGSPVPAGGGMGMATGAPRTRFAAMNAVGA
ncbi:hypothetical protein HYH02_004796 [Chlamydomonas schloesseri]|uniref:Uncharacterized protein n=1 Tax=Chlamydomonas schloesseri TaxID=2026947 RepID=A0A835WN57_9CHLO|nr:hypothetical protein HYH02_004796 [Chlamydomonas schloesseri]|eukprot:KAG2450288.1 hypothetical protein HYH02_004796 [Chlamydomonas schloesseri]